MIKDFKSLVKVALVACLAFMSSCEYTYTVKYIDGGRVAMTEEYDQPIKNQEVAAILDQYQGKMDSIMSPVIGHAAKDLFKFHPESPMSNLMADLLFRSCEKCTGKKADIAIMNMGGIRSAISHGPITCGNIYEVSPFENTLCILEMSGESIFNLFTQIAANNGEGISGAKLVISKDGKLLSAKVGGKPIDFKKTYIVSTLDYVAEGNDKMTAFLEAKSKEFPRSSTLRELLMNYVKDCESKGILIDAQVEGRIIVK